MKLAEAPVSLPDRPAPPKGEDRAALSVMVTSHAVQHFYVAGLALTYPLVVAEFHISYAVLGVVLTVSGLVGGLLQAAAGSIRHMSARVVLGVQNIGLAAASVLGAVVPGFALFGAARCLGALVSWPQHPVGSAYLSERFPERKGAVLSWHTAGGSLGTVVIPLFASWVISIAGWRWALVAIAIPMALGGVLVLIKLPSEHHALEADDVDDVSGGMTWAAVWHVLRDRRVLLILAASTIAAGGRGLGTISTFVPAYLDSDLHMGQYEVGGIFTVLLAASVVGPIIAGHLADQLGRSRLVVISYVGGAISMVAFVVVGANLAALIASGLAVGVLAYAESPLLQAVFADATRGSDQRTTFGVYFAVAYGVGALWLALLGWVIDASGFQAAFMVMAVTFLAAAGLVVMADRTPSE